MSYPYTLKISSLRDFISKIPRIGIPEKINTKTLPAMGYKLKNDRAIATILKFINFLDNKGVPTENYKNFRSKAESGSVMANCLRQSYIKLFSLYPDAHKRSDQELRDFFSTKTTAGETVLNQTVNTFKTLCEFADLEAEPIEVVGVPPVPIGKPITEEIKPTVLPLNINIQIQLPVTENVEVYDKIFEALRKRLIDRKKEAS